MNSTPKKIIVPSPQEDDSYVPSSHKYTYFLDFKETKGPDLLLEKPLEPEEIEKLSAAVDKIIKVFNTQLPKPLTKPKDIEFIQKIWPIFSKSEYRTDICDYILQQENFRVTRIRKDNRHSDKKFLKSINPDLLSRLLELYYERYTPKYILFVIRPHMGPADVMRFISIMDGKGIELIEDLYPMNLDAVYPQEIDDLIVQQAEDPNFRCISLLDRSIMISEQTGIKVKDSYVRNVLAKHNYSHRQTQSVYPKIDNTGHKNTRLHVIKTLIELIKSGKEMVSVDETQLNRSLTKSHA